MIGLFSFFLFRITEIPMTAYGTKREWTKKPLKSPISVKLLVSMD
jgi:hypothetical protein